LIVQLRIQSLFPAKQTAETITTRSFRIFSRKGASPFSGRSTFFILSYPPRAVSSLLPMGEPQPVQASQPAAAE
jgi:hypothetical protein